MSKSNFSLRAWGLVAALVVALAFLPAFASRFYVYLAALVLVRGLLATSLNLVLGYGGLYQFHHSVFFGFGAYAAALVITKTELSPWLAFLAGPLAAAGLSLVMGLICIRLSKLYFGMLQISLGSLVWAIIFRWYSFTGGDDGIHNIPLPAAISSGVGSYYFVLAVTLACLGLMYMVVGSPFGRVFQGIRDNPERAEVIGVPVRRHQLVGLVIAGFFGGASGCLFMAVERTVFPDLMFWTLSLEIIVMCLLGGWFTFLGPFLGAAIIVLLRTMVGIYTEYWTLFLGVILMLVIFFLPQGVLGYFLERFRGKPQAAPARKD